jgi:putative flavoprotein involved in K+ transport
VDAGRVNDPLAGPQPVPCSMGSSMRTTDTIVIGAGQAGLAASRCLTDHGSDHIVFERGRVAERWRSERWDSLRLLTPIWMSRLPGWSYAGPDPDGFMTATDLVGYLEDYAMASAAPVEQCTTVERLTFDGECYDVDTDQGSWRSANVIVATGWCDRPAIPPFARHVARGIHQLAPRDYRNPAGLRPGGVLVVGASATGVQLADELHRAGRAVTVAVGGHSRLPRRYRGMDIYWWLERIGNLDRTIDELPDPIAARREPSLQLVGNAEGRSLDLSSLQHSGVRLTGRLVAADGHHVELAGDLAATAALADRRMYRVLGDVDSYIDTHGLGTEVLAPDPPAPLQPRSTPDRLDLRAARITTIIWATGHRRTYPWLDLPVLDDCGEIRQRRGVTPAPGLYVLGQRFQHHRNSNFIDGVGRDAAFVADHLDGRTTAVCRG